MAVQWPSLKMPHQRWSWVLIKGPISLALESGSPASTFLQTPADKLRSEDLSTFTLTAV